MSLRCGCPDDGDEVVFDQCRKCSPQPQGEVDLVGAFFGAIQRARELRQSDFTLSPQEPRERPWEYVLGPEEVEG